MAKPDIAKGKIMKISGDFEFDDLQGLVRFGYGKLTSTCFLLLNIKDAAIAKQWLDAAPVSNAVKVDKQHATALHIAFTSQGLCELGLGEIVKGFSDEFIYGMSSDPSRSRRLGDIDANAPEYWHWGGDPKNIPHILLLLYADPKLIDMEDWRKKIENKNFYKAFHALATLPTLHTGETEPFGFADGISQPLIDWQRQQSTNPHDRFGYSNCLAVGEVVLGYPNEYQQYTARPLIDPQQDKLATILPDAEEQPTLKDFGRNGTYLVLRQLGQDVPAFWQFVDKAAGSEPKNREQLAAAMVGRNRDGTPLVTKSAETIPGIPEDDDINHFTYETDPAGHKCPVGAHVRRANPRTGDLPGKVTGWWSWFLKISGYGLNWEEEDLVASTRFHRLLRRGRSYGSKLLPEDAIKPNAPTAERGLQFICLVGNIMRQFEFVQNAWIANSKFAGLQQERDPLLGHRKPLMTGEVTDQFHHPESAGPMQKTCHLPQFITVRGGAYFFMPGLRTLKYIAAAPLKTKPKGSDS
jgi:deferrochelatase/peroxidase EfeB